MTNHHADSAPHGKANRGCVPPVPTRTKTVRLTVNVTALAGSRAFDPGHIAAAVETALKGIPVQGGRVQRAVASPYLQLHAFEVFDMFLSRMAYAGSAENAEEATLQAAQLWAERLYAQSRSFSEISTSLPGMSDNERALVQTFIPAAGGEHTRQQKLSMARLFAQQWEAEGSTILPAWRLHAL